MCYYDYDYDILSIKFCLFYSITTNKVNRSATLE